MRRVGLGGDRRAVTEVPLIPDRLTRILVQGARAAEVDRQRRGAVGAVGREHGLRRALALDVLPLVHAGVRVGGEEAVAVGQQVQGAVGAELHVHRVVALEQEQRRAELAAVQRLVDLEHAVLRVQLDLAQRVLRELTQEDRLVVVGRELLRVRVRRVVVVLHGAVRADAARVELREQPRALRRRARSDRPRRRRVLGEARRAQRVGRAVVRAAVPDLGVGDRRDLAQARLVARAAVEVEARVVDDRVGAAVDRLRRAERQRSGLAEVPLVVAEGLRVTDRVAVVRRLAHDLEAPDAGRPTAALRVPRVRRVVADVGDVVLVDLDPERVAEAHRVDLGPRLGLRLAVDQRVQVPRGDRVRAATAVVGLVGVRGRDVAVLDLEAQDLPAQVVGVQRRTPVITGRALVQPPLSRPSRCRRRDRGGHRRVRAGQAGAGCCGLRLVRCDLPRRKNTFDVGRVHRAARRLDLVGPMFDSASSAASIAAAFAFHAIGSVVCR